MEKVEFTGYIAKNKCLPESDKIGAIELEDVDMTIYPNEAYVSDWEEGEYPPKKVKVTIEVIDG